ncbi:MAG TPA: hypothetical protein VF633_03700 [Brevundimonas sp.]
MVEGGRNLNGDFYAFDGRDFRFHDPEADRRYRSFLDSLGVTAAAGIPCPVLCTFGGNFHYLSRQEVWDGFRIPNSPLEGRYLSQAAFEAAVRAMISGALAFQADLVGLGLTVSFALPPRRVPVTASRWAFLEIERAVPPMFAALGVGIIDLRSETLDREGTLRSEFAHPDPADDTHGSVAFGAMVVARAIGARDVPTP